MRGRFYSVKFSLLIFLCTVLLLALRITSKWDWPFLHDFADGHKEHPAHIITKGSTESVTTEAVKETSHVQSATQGTSMNQSDFYCKFPRLDPWDPEIINLIQYPQRLKCPKVQPDDIAYLDIYGYLHFNQTSYEQIEGKIRERMNCTYSMIDRGPGDFDHALNKTQPIRFDRDTLPVPLTTDVVEVKCIAGLDETEIYYNLFVHPMNLTKPLRTNTETQLSVLMFVVDSCSLSAFERHLPNTYAYLTSVMKVRILRGYTKIGDNTFPNMVAVLTGKRVYNQTPEMLAEYTENYRQMHYDHWDIIWKRYAAQGYITSFNEDVPDLGTFHYLAQGFKTKPVDHYYLVFWNAMRDSILYFQKSQRHCYGNTQQAFMQTDIIRRHWIKYRDKQQFMYAFYTGISHDRAHEMQQADNIFAEFFKHMHEQGYFNHTAVIFMSDHGHRFGPLRQTLVGSLEERMPVFSIYFPPWFYQKYPQIDENLRKNEMRLSSPFDVHETLLDIVNGDFKGEQRKPGARGLSQLYSIPLDRTCFEAGIPEYYCVCYPSENIDLGSSLATSAAYRIVEHVTALLANQKKCVQLSYNRTLRAEILHIKNKEGMSHSWRALRLQVEVKPSGALLEGLVKINEKQTGGEQNLEVYGDISRTNAYGKQSSCVQDAFLRLYCYCTDYVASVS